MPNRFIQDERGSVMAQTAFVAIAFTTAFLTVLGHGHLQTNPDAVTIMGSELTNTRPVRMVQEPLPVVLRH